MVSIIARLLTVPQSDDELPRLLASFAWDLRVGEPIRQDVLLPVFEGAQVAQMPVWLELSRPVVEGPVAPAWSREDLDRVAALIGDDEYPSEPLDPTWGPEARAVLQWLDDQGRLLPADPVDGPEVVAGVPFRIGAGVTLDDAWAATVEGVKRAGPDV